ncbi:hypothetical protein [Pseudomonas saponiphila]|uniref:hypothetical protein n=1 Tax=Pseudomonas saponiphila TaxID=556534 RepID=UPI0022402365|nr:hypothetical protein [Pseudomonas saponiphila]
MKKIEIPESMKEASVWAVWVFLAVGAVGWALFVVLRAFDVTKDAAAWVQAVGSIAAIWGAFSISNAQVRRQEELKVQEGKRRSQAQFAVVKNAADYGKTMGEFASKKPPAFAFVAAWRTTLDVTTAAALDSMRVLPVHDLGSYEQVLHFNGILASLVQLRADVNKFVNSGDESNDLVLDAYRSIEAQSKMIEYSWNKFQIAFDEYSSS